MGFSQYPIGLKLNLAANNFTDFKLHTSSKEYGSRLANRGLDNIMEDFDKIRKESPTEAAKLYLKLLEYIVPKKSSMEISGEIHQKIQQISVNIQDGTQHQHIKDV